MIRSTGSVVAETLRSLGMNVPTLVSLFSFRDVPSWDVIVEHGEWVLKRPGMEDMLIGDEKVPQGIAIDAALDYMDRVRLDNMPPFCDSPGSLMAFCVGQSWKASA